MPPRQPFLPALMLTLLYFQERDLLQQSGCGSKQHFFQKQQVHQKSSDFSTLLHRPFDTHGLWKKLRRKFYRRKQIDRSEALHNSWVAVHVRAWVTFISPPFLPLHIFNIKVKDACKRNGASHDPLILHANSSRLKDLFVHQVSVKTLLQTW